MTTRSVPALLGFLSAALLVGCQTDQAASGSSGPGADVTLTVGMRLDEAQKRLASVDALDVSAMTGTMPAHVPGEPQPRLLTYTLRDGTWLQVSAGARTGQPYVVRDIMIGPKGRRYADKLERAQAEQMGRIRSVQSVDLSRYVPAPHESLKTDSKLES